MPINYKDYHPEWKTVIRPRILDRAKNKCEFCGIENYAMSKRNTKVVLTIAHLDHNKSNNADENLRALCQACHLAYDSEIHIANRKRNREQANNKNQMDLF